jgi:hypothetical protein
VARDGRVPVQSGALRTGSAHPSHLVAGVSDAALGVLANPVTSVEVTKLTRRSVHGSEGTAGGAAIGPGLVELHAQPRMCSERAAADGAEGDTGPGMPGCWGKPDGDWVG